MGIMSMERVATFAALFDRAAMLLASDSGNAAGRIDEALLLIGYLRKNFSQPFSTAEIDQLVEGEAEDQRNGRARLNNLRQRQQAAQLGQSCTLAAAE
jgi:hypothetical protein